MIKHKTKTSKVATAFVGDEFLRVARRLRKALDDDPNVFRQVAKGLGLGLRKAYSLVQIDRRFHKLQVRRERLRRIGWTKLVILAPHVTKENVAELLDLAETQTAHELRRWLRFEPVHEKEHCVMLYLSADQYELFEDVMLAYGAFPSGRGLLGKEAGWRPPWPG